VDKGHGPCPVLKILLEPTPGLRFLVGSVKAQKRDECSQVVLDPVVDLGKENFFFREGFF